MENQFILVLVLAVLAIFSFIYLICKFFQAAFHIIEENEAAIVTRLGRFRRVLQPGLNFIWPFTEKIAFKEGLQERPLDVPPQEVITKDSISIEVDAILYWKITSIKRVYYEVDNLEDSLQEVAMSTLRAKIGSLELQETYSFQEQINSQLIYELDNITSQWGVQITLVKIQNIVVPERLQESLELQQVAASRKQAMMKDIEGLTVAAKELLKIIEDHPGQGSEILRFLLARQYMDVNEKLSQSPNSKILFVDPKVMDETISGLLDMDTDPRTDHSDG